MNSIRVERQRDEWIRRIKAKLLFTLETWLDASLHHNSLRHSHVKVCGECCNKKLRIVIHSIPHHRSGQHQNRFESHQIHNLSLVDFSSTIYNYVLKCRPTPIYEGPKYFTIHCHSFWTSSSPHHGFYYMLYCYKFYLMLNSGVLIFLP